MASFMLVLGILALFWDGLPWVAKIMMIGGLVVMFFGYGTIGAFFATRSQGDYVPAKPIRWKR